MIGCVSVSFTMWPSIRALTRSPVPPVGAHCLGIWQVAAAFPSSQIRVQLWSIGGSFQGPVFFVVSKCHDSHQMLRIDMEQAAFLDWAIGNGYRANDYSLTSGTTCPATVEYKASGVVITAAPTCISLTYDDVNHLNSLCGTLVARVGDVSGQSPRTLFRALGAAYERTLSHDMTRAQQLLCRAFSHKIRGRCVDEWITEGIIRTAVDPQLVDSLIKLVHVLPFDFVD